MNDSNILSAKNKEGEIRSDKIPKKYGTIRYVSKELEQTKLFHGEEDIIFNIIFNINSNPNYIKKELLFFKDEILKEIKIFNSKLTEKSKNNEKYMNDKIDKFSRQIGVFNQK